jgi:hypothetical protein
MVDDASCNSTCVRSFAPNVCYKKTTDAHVRRACMTHFHTGTYGVGGIPAMKAASVHFGGE